MPSPTPPRPSFYRWPIIILGVLLAAVLVYRLSTPPPASNQGHNSSNELPRIGTVPTFNLTERSGKNISNKDLAGKIWVADFVYTTCPGPCPMITANMAKIQAATAKDPRVQLVTFTVDPQSDTPAVLAAYADRYAADHDKWWFLTGPEKPLYDLIQNGFFQVVQDNRGKPPEDGQFQVTHSTYFVLVDGNGSVRGSFDGVGADGRADLLKSIKMLEKEETE